MGIRVICPNEKLTGSEARLETESFRSGPEEFEIPFGMYRGKCTAISSVYHSQIQARWDLRTVQGAVSWEMVIRAREEMSTVDRV